MYRRPGRSATRSRNAAGHGPVSRLSAGPPAPRTRSCAAACRATLRTAAPARRGRDRPRGRRAAPASPAGRPGAGTRRGRCQDRPCGTGMRRAWPRSATSVGVSFMQSADLLPHASLVRAVPCSCREIGALTLSFIAEPHLPVGDELALVELPGSVGPATLLGAVRRYDQAAVPADQDAGVQDAVLLGAAKLLAVENEHARGRPLLTTRSSGTDPPSLTSVIAA